MRNVLAYLHLFVYSLSQYISSGLVTLGQSLWTRKQTQLFSNLYVAPQPGPAKLACEPFICVAVKPVILLISCPVPEAVSSDHRDCGLDSGAAEAGWL